MAIRVNARAFGHSALPPSRAPHSSPGRADQLNGTYKGAVLLKTTYFLAQLDDATKQAVIHDRLMLDTGRKGADNEPPTYAQRESLTIQYSPANAPRIERHGPEPMVAAEALAAKQAKPKSRGR